MLTRLFKSAPLLDAGTTNWILDTYTWAFENFEFSVFKRNTQLIIPNNKFYPGDVNSVHNMASRIFELTLKYAGMENWPIYLVEPANYQHRPLNKLALSSSLRGGSFHVVENKNENDKPQDKIYVTYNTNQINQPQDLIASFAQTFAAIIIFQSGKIPPGGQDNLPQAIELLACFMGFGVMFSNTAYQFKGGCGSCYNPHANREVALPEIEMIFCLAIFCLLKNISMNDVLPNLKTHLRKSFKRAHKELTAESKKSTNQTLLDLINY